MAMALRLLWIILATAVCLALQAALFELFRSLPGRFSLLDLEAQVSTLAWGAVFRGLAFVIWGTVPAVLIFTVLELRRVRGALIYVALWSLVTLAAAAATTAGIEKPAAAAASGLISGLVYWALAGRSAGRWLDSVKRYDADAQGVGWRKALNLAAYGLVALIVLQALGPLVFVAKLVWVSTVWEPSPSVPPFKTWDSVFGREPSVFHKVALIDFPDPASCLVEGADTSSPEGLKRMNWDKIRNSADAEVCVFRLLASHDDLTHATEWLEHQGFRVGDRFSSANPYREANGDLRITGTWSIRENGPRFPTSGVILRLAHALPYGMSVNATWSPDGTSVQYVRITFSTL